MKSEYTEKFESNFKENKKLIKQLMDEGLDYHTIVDTMINSGYEFWQSIDDFEGMYSFSNLGRVRNDRTGKILEPSGRIFLDYNNDIVRCYQLSKNRKRICRYVKDIFSTVYWDYKSSILYYKEGVLVNTFSNVYEASTCTDISIDEILEACHYWDWKSKHFNKDGISIRFSLGVSFCSFK